MIVIEGQNRLSGSVKLSGNKNAALPIIAASLLTSDKVTVHNVPDIGDVNTMLEILSYCGVNVSKPEKNTVIIHAENLKIPSIPEKLCKKIRASLLFVAPFLYRLGKTEIFPPGGDVIGRRRMDTHFYGLRCLGAELDVERLPFKFTLHKNFKGRELFFDEASVTATEQILMAAAVAEGVTIIRNAASEPHVVDLANFLVKMGARIEGIETKTITVYGVKNLRGIEYTLINDHIEAGTFLAMAAATGGNVSVVGTYPIRDYWMIRRVFEKFGVELAIKSPDKTKDVLYRNISRQHNVSISSPNDSNHNPYAYSISLNIKNHLKIEKDYGNSMPVISDGPWPNYPSDMMSCTIVMAVQAYGSVLFFEKMFESRLYFVDRLIQMGADIVVCDPHRVVVSGPSKLHGITLSSPDIRAGMAMIIAALCAKGQTIIHGAEVIKRGYENIVEKIQSLGGIISYEDK